MLLRRHYLLLVWTRMIFSESLNFTKNVQIVSDPFVKRTNHYSSNVNTLSANTVKNLDTVPVKQTSLALL